VQQLVYSWFLRILVFKIKRAESPLLPELLKTFYQNEFSRCRGRDLALLPHEKSCRTHSECWITGTERPPGRADMTYDRHRKQSILAPEPRSYLVEGVVGFSRTEVQRPS
jgi:hypothetical protein